MGSRWVQLYSLLNFISWESGVRVHVVSWPSFPTVQPLLCVCCFELKLKVLCASSAALFENSNCLIICIIMLFEFKLFVLFCDFLRNLCNASFQLNRSLSVFLFFGVFLFVRVSWISSFLVPRNLPVWRGVAFYSVVPDRDRVCLLLWPFRAWRLSNFCWTTICARDLASWFCSSKTCSDMELPCNRVLKCP